ncbi:MAG: methylated-DNA--[protein]-cysteine S-methyltransferase, partial [Pseudonocardiaceae bacterium]
MRFSVYPSAVGPLLLAGDDDALTRLAFGDASGAPREWERDDGRFAAEHDQLDEYFAGTRTEFGFPTRLGGSPFERAVWEALREIPYGSTTTYGELAAQLGKPGRARAVGAANGRNPIAIVVPCHRVIGAGGKLTGYGGGLHRMRALRAREGAMLA